MPTARLLPVVVVGLADAYEVAEDALTHLKCMEVTRLRRLDGTFALEGWLPEEWVDELRTILERASGGRATLERDEEPATGPRTAPVLLENPRLARPFEYMVELFSMPGRADYDPTRITALLLPLFFGFAIGDVVHGIAVALVALWIRRRVPTPVGRLVAAILLAGGIWATVFGAFVYGEALGFHLPPPFPPPLLERTRDVLPLLGLSLVVGLLHIGLGLTIGFVYERRQAGLRVAVLGKLSWLLVEAGLVLLALALLPLALRWALAPALGLLALGVLLVGLGGGLTELLEVPAFVGNIASYLRLAALALVEGILGLAVNGLLLDHVLHRGPVAAAIGLIVLVLAHGLFLAMAVLVVALQCLRLHYVEFYTKFYELSGPGRPHAFDPSGRPPAQAAP